MRGRSDGSVDSTGRECDEKRRLENAAWNKRGSLPLRSASYNEALVWTYPVPAKVGLDFADIMPNARVFKLRECVRELNVPMQDKLCVYSRRWRELVPHPDER